MISQSCGKFLRELKILRGGGGGEGELFIQRLCDRSGDKLRAKYARSARDLRETFATFRRPIADYGAFRQVARDLDPI